MKRRLAGGKVREVLRQSHPQKGNAMTDLVERLRDVRKRFESGTPQFTDQIEFVTSEAADEIERLQKQIFALRAAEVANQTLYRETKRMAGVEANNERLQARVAEAADEIERLRAQVESLSEQLTMESIDTTCHCAAKSAADCGCPGAVWPEDTLRAENGRLREALHTARDGLAHIKAVARLHAEGADTALEGRS